MVENIMIKQIFSVFFDLILFIHAWKKQTILIIRKKKKKKKDCVFFSFWQHVQYLFQWKGENTEKKNHIFVAPKQWNFFLYLCPPEKINSKKVKKNKTRQNIEQLISASIRDFLLQKLRLYPQILRGYK